MTVAHLWLARLLGAILLYALIPSVCCDTNDVRLKRLGSFTDAQVASKQISKQIRCSLCGVASEQISANIGRKRFKSEAAVLEEIGTLCSGKDGEDSFDFILEKQGWTVVEGDEGYELQQSAGDKAERQDLMDGFGKRDSMKQACHLVVDEHESELAEFLFTELQAKKNIDSDSIKRKLCFDLSRACRKPTKKKTKGVKRVGSRQDL